MPDDKREPNDRKLELANESHDPVMNKGDRKLVPLNADHNVRAVTDTLPDPKGDPGGKRR